MREAVHLWASLYRSPVDGDRLLEQLGLADKRNAWFMTLSGGQKQRLFIALALINDPELVFREIRRPVFSSLRPPLARACRYISFDRLERELDALGDRTRHYFRAGFLSI